MRTAQGVLAVVRELADEVLFPDAMRVDHRGQPRSAAGREAVFLLVFGSRPGIKSALLQRLGAAAPGK